MPRNVLAGKSMEELASEYVIRTDPKMHEHLPSKMYGTAELFKEMTSRDGFAVAAIHIERAKQAYALLTGDSYG